MSGVEQSTDRRRPIPDPRHPIRLLSTRRRSRIVSGRTPPDPRSAYPHFLEITTRWNDNDPYRHVNNAVYYEYFDTVVNQYLIANGALDLEAGSVIGLVVETQCRYFSQIA